MTTENDTAVTAWISVGSNIERERSIQNAIHDLRALFGTLRISPVYETDAQGFDGDPFLNLVVGIETTLPVSRIVSMLRTIEIARGRQRRGARFSARAVDLDLLTYGDHVGVIDRYSLPREDIVQYNFVLAPLTDIAPDELHPQLKRTYADLWEQFSPKTGLRQYPLTL